MFDPLTPILIYLITAGAKEFCYRVLGIELPASASALIASVIGAFVVFANGFAAQIPAAWLPTVGAIVALLVAIASAFGIHATVKKFQR
jgi:hypothetical protein